jgi:hypothetical protein
VNALKETVQRGVDDTLKFAFRQQFHLKALQSLTRGIKQRVRRACLFRTLVIHSRLEGSIHQPPNLVNFVGVQHSYSL